MPSNCKNAGISLPASLIGDLKEIASHSSPKQSLSELVEPVLRDWADKKLSAIAKQSIEKSKIWDRTYPLVDLQDKSIADSVKWRSTPNGWINRKRVKGKQIAVYLHREILGVTGNQSFQVIFDNGDRLDCRRKNLKLLTMSELRQQ